MLLLHGLVSLTVLPLAWLAERHYRRLPLLPAGPAPTVLPPLSIIIPARNEAANLPRLLPSLQNLCYPGRVEIIVVDDASNDDTAAIAIRHGARVLRLDGPPPGWSGKAYACHRGAQLAQGDWLLFTDADTWHRPHGPAQAVAHALRHHADGLSLFLDQATNGWVDGVALMVAHAGYFAGLRDPAGVLNGQYVLLRRDAYQSSGGFATVRHDVTEDLALGHHLRGLGYRVPILRGERAGRVHMYHDARSMWQGLARFGVTSLRWTGLSSLLAVLFVILVAAPVELLLAALVSRRSFRAVAATWLATATGLLPWARRFGGRRWALLAPLGALQVQFAAIWGILRRLTGRGISWKERML